MKNLYEEEKESSSTKSNQTNKEFVQRKERERERVINEEIV